MKIIGGHDYYDGAGYGVDETIIFVRKEEERWDAPFDLPQPTSETRHWGPNLSFHYVLVAGKVYPAIRERHRSEYRQTKSGHMRWIDERNIWHYDEASAQAALKKLYHAKDDRRSLPLGLFRRLPDEITRHFREVENQSWTTWMIENRIITGLASWEYRNKDREGTVLRTNISDLKDIDFFKALDPATIHMEISNYIGGVLPSGPETVEISDLSRIQKAGFDVRKSFRQDAGVKKPRRKRGKR